MNRLQKQQKVASIHDVFNSSSSVIVTHYQGLTVSEVSELRKNIRENGAGFKVYKNSLLRLAAKNTSFSELINLFSGPTAIAFANDPVAAAKTIVEYSEKNDKLVILGGMVDRQIVGVQDIKSLSKLPPLDHLRSMLIGIINAPATKIAGVLQAPAGQIARLLNAHAEKMGN